MLVLVLLLREGCLNLQDVARRASCRPNTVFWTCESYAKDHAGVFPALAPVPGMLFYDTEICKILPCFEGDNICEFDLQGEEDHAFRQLMYEHPRNDWSYVYLGYVIETEPQMLAFFQAYRSAVGQGHTFEPPLEVGAGRGTDGTEHLRRLQSLDSLLAVKDPLALRADRIPVVIEWPENHRYPGGHVVFLDGHRELIAYPGKFPMTTAVITGLRELDNFAKL